MRRRSAGRKWFGRTLSALGTVLVLSTVFALPATADPSPGGNNGTVKVDGGDLEGNANDPHVGCSFNIEWFGFDQGTQTSSVTFEGQAPTGGGPFLADTFTFEGGGAGGQRDAFKAYDLSSALQDITPQQNQGWHVKLTVETTGSKGNDSKHKTFWVTGCGGEIEDPPVVGSITLDKVLAGEGAPQDDPAFTFEVACDDPGAVVTSPVTIKASESPVTVATEVPVGTVCTVTETGSGGAAFTQFAATDGASSTGDLVILAPADGTAVGVTATNTFDPEIVDEPVVGSITLDKVLAGEGAPQDDPAFIFEVACDDPGAVVTSPVTIKASDAALTIASNVAADTECTVTETGNGGADSTSFVVNGDAPVSADHISVTLDNSSTVAVVATNAFEADVIVDPPVVGSITLDKVLAGTDVPKDDPSFTFAVACDDPAALVRSPVTIKASDAALTIASNVAAGTDCTVTETDAHGASSTSFTVNGGVAVSGTHVTATPADESAVAVVATNTFEATVLGEDITPDDPGTPTTTTTPATPGTQTVSNDPAVVSGNALARTGLDTRLFLLAGGSLILAGFLLRQFGSSLADVGDR